MDRWTATAHLTRDPELVMTSGGTEICLLRIAVKRAGRDGEAGYFDGDIAPGLTPARWRSQQTDPTAELASGRPASAVPAAPLGSASIRRVDPQCEVVWSAASPPMTREAGSSSGHGSLAS